MRSFHFLSLLVVSWCVMVVTHELGHLLGGWCCGGRLIDFDLWPWHLPYSLFSPDPCPLVRLWAGPLLGVSLPLAIASIVRRDDLWFVAHFCVLANGVYLAVGWLSGDRFLDSPQLLTHGAPPALLAVYCVLTIGYGYVAFRRDCIAMWRV